MKLWPAGILAIAFVFLFQVRLAKALIFEADDRQNLFEVQRPEVAAIARSIFTFIEKDQLIQRPDGQYEFRLKRTYGDYINFCEPERFSAEPAPGTFCTGYLVANDIGITAGHCVDETELQTFCSKYYIVFDYDITAPGQPRTIFPASSVQTCQSILAREYADFDYTVLRFKQPLQDRTPLRYRKSGSVSEGDTFLTMGHPKGLPLKISDSGARMTGSNEVNFFSDLNTMHGNSGGPVINSRTLEVEGHVTVIDGQGWPDVPIEMMLADFEYDSPSSCYRTWICRKSEGCTAAAGIFRITNISSQLDRLIGGPKAQSEVNP